MRAHTRSFEVAASELSESGTGTFGRSLNLLETPECWRYATFEASLLEAS